VASLAAAADSGAADAFGDLLFGIVALARTRDVDAEEALRMAVRRLREHVAAQEAAQEAAQKVASDRDAPGS
jgi:uncharacterized protein YabN with tetrapyrrole methylase and pyrophosphatase domain